METCTEKKDNLFVTVTIRKSPGTIHADEVDGDVQHINIEIDEKHDSSGEFLEVKIIRSKDKHRRPKF